MVRVAPITVKAALKKVRAWHRHLPDLQGGLFAVQVINANECVGVGIAGNPARVWQDQAKIVISRVAAIECPDVVDRDGKLHACPACTMLYAALCRAAKALGYQEIWTYTLPDETGKSLYASGFKDMGLTDGGEWSRPSRSRGPAKRPERKRRWLRILTSRASETAPPAVSTESASSSEDSRTQSALRRETENTGEQP